MKFTKVIAFPIWPDKIRFQWEIENPYLEGKYTFRLYKSGSSEGPWEEIALPMIDKETYLLDKIPLLSTEVRNTLFFRITCDPPKTNSRRGWKQFEKIFTLYHGLDKIEFLKAKEIVRKENLRFSKQIGVPVYVLKQKRFGEKCNQCIDECTKAIIDPDCIECFGTRYIGGYHTPVRIWAEIVEPPVSMQIVEIATTTEDKTANIRLTNEIIVNKQDFIIDVINNNRWEVSSQPNIIQYRTFPIGQQLTAIMREPKDIIYKFPIEEIQ